MKWGHRTTFMRPSQVERELEWYRGYDIMQGVSEITQQTLLATPEHIPMTIHHALPLGSKIAKPWSARATRDRLTSYLAWYCWYGTDRISRVRRCLLCTTVVLVRFSFIKTLFCRPVDKRFWSSICTNLLLGGNHLCKFYSPVQGVLCIFHVHKVSVGHASLDHRVVYPRLSRQLLQRRYWRLSY